MCCTYDKTQHYTTRTYRLEPPLQYHCCHLIDVLELLRTRDVLRPIHEEGLQGQGFGLQTEKGGGDQGRGAVRRCYIRFKVYVLRKMLCATHQINESHMGITAITSAYHITSHHVTSIITSMSLQYYPLLSSNISPSFHLSPVGAEQCNVGGLRRQQKQQGRPLSTPSCSAANSMYVL